MRVILDNKPLYDLNGNIMYYQVPGEPINGEVRTLLRPRTARQTVIDSLQAMSDEENKEQKKNSEMRLNDWVLCERISNTPENEPIEINASELVRIRLAVSAFQFLSVAGRVLKLLENLDK